MPTSTSAQLVGALPRCVGKQARHGARGSWAPHSGCWRRWAWGIRRAAQRELLATGGTACNRPVRTAGAGEGLTAQEAQVARLAQDGRLAGDRRPAACP
jgi:hypothetical protein